MKYLYKYPQKAYPYSDLVKTNAKRSRHDTEYELLDTGVFNGDRYFEVFMEYAKAAPDDILIKITVCNRGSNAAPIHVLPTIWFRNTWSRANGGSRPTLKALEGTEHKVILAHHTDPLFQESLQDFILTCEGNPTLLFTENETNLERLLGKPNASPHVKDSINNYIVHGNREAINPELSGTKASVHYLLNVGAGETSYIRLAGALTVFQRLLLLATETEDRARAYLWIGKSQDMLGDQTSAQESWQQGQLADPAGYYGMRSRELLLGRAPFEAPASVNLNPDLEQERKEAEAWLRVSFNLPPETDLSGPGALAEDPRFVRGTELWELGMYDEARLEFESLRESVELSPTDNFRLANHLREIGLYRSAVFAARQVLSLAGNESQQSSLNAPLYFNHMRYGLYYHDVVIEEAQKYGLDPLFHSCRQKGICCSRCFLRLTVCLSMGNALV